MTDKNTANYQIKQAQLSILWLKEKLLNHDAMMQDNEINVVAEAIATISKVLYVDFVKQEQKPKTVKTKKIKTAKSNTLWDVEDDAKLLYLYQNKNSSKAIAKLLERSVRSIECRLNQHRKGKIK